MSLILLRVDVRPESVGEVEAAARTMFAALNEQKPEGVRYASCRIDDGHAFVILLQVADGIENPLPGIPAFVEFQSSLRGLLTGPPHSEQLAVVGSYNLFWPR